MADGDVGKSIVADVMGSAEEAAVADVVRRFNRDYLVVNEAGKAVILQPGFDPILKRRSLDRMTPADLRILYMNEMVEVGKNKDGSPLFKGAADVWLRHRDRRQYIAGVTFDPTNSTAPGVLNLWQGYAVTPAPGNWSRLQAHIEQVICAGNPVHFRYLMGWMARLIQRPAEQGEVAVIMKGGEGVGKGTLAKALKRIIGQHALAISNAKHLVGNFNSHLRDCVFLFADEAFFAGDRAHVGVLKSIITESYLTVEGKYVNAVEVPNYLHLMMASNEEWVVPASLDARRFFVLEVLSTVANDHKYFAAIWEQMEAGGYAAMLHDLLAFDLTTFNVRAVPTTDGLHHQRKLSLETTEAWWLDCLERGYVFRSRLGLEEEFATWHPRVTMELLFASYSDFAKARGVRRPLSREALGKFLLSIGAQPGRWRNGVVGEHIADEKNGYGDTVRKSKPVKQDRATGYHIDDLDEARTAFLAVTGLSVTWDGGAAAGLDSDE